MPLNEAALGPASRPQRPHLQPSLGEVKMETAFASSGRDTVFRENVITRVRAALAGGDEHSPAATGIAGSLNGFYKIGGLTLPS